MDTVGIPPDVVGLFEDATKRVIAQGITRYSARAIMHRIRWHMHVERGDREFVFNNNWTPTLARWFMEKNPEHSGLFETRKLRA